MAFPSTAIARTELGVQFDEFQTEASRKGFIGPSVLRPILVGERSADVPRIALGHMLSATEDTARAPKAGYSRRTWEFGKFSYNCQEYGVEEVLDDAHLATYRSLVDAELVSRNRAVDRVLRPYEVAVAAAVFDLARWTIPLGLQTAVAKPWTSKADATPIDDVAAARRAVWSRTGLWPNAVVVSQPVYEAVRNCDQVMDRVVSGGSARDPARVGREALAALFEVGQVLVADGAKNVSLNPDEPDLESIWGDYCMVCRVAESIDLAEPCIGRTFLWPGDGAAEWSDNELAVLIEEYREEARRGSVLRARTYYQASVLMPEAGQLLSGVV